MAVQNACNDYCAKAKECRDEVDEDNCYEQCLDSMTNCQADEQDQAVEQLGQCSEETCDDFIGCTIDAGAQCFFGI